MYAKQHMWPLCSSAYEGNCASSLSNCHNTKHESLKLFNDASMLLCESLYHLAVWQPPTHLKGSWRTLHIVWRMHINHSVFSYQTYLIPQLLFLLHNACLYSRATVTSASLASHAVRMYSKLNNLFFKITLWKRFGFKIHWNRALNNVLHNKFGLISTVLISNSRICCCFFF